MLFVLFALAQAASASTMAAEPAPPAEFHLICEGVNDAEATHTNLGLGIFAGHTAGAVSTSSEHYQTAPEPVSIEISGGEGRIHLPARLYTHMYHPSGWLDLAEVKVSNDMIEAKLQWSWASHPRVTIDRRIGLLSVNTMLGGYAGKCSAIAPDAHAF